MALLSIKLTEQDIRQAIAEYLSTHYNMEVAAKEINIEAKSKQNFRSEWERADIRVDQQVIAQEK